MRRALLTATLLASLVAACFPAAETAPEPPARPEAAADRLIDCAGVTAAIANVSVFEGPEQFTPEEETPEARYYWLMLALIDKDGASPDETRTLVEASRLRWADQPPAVREERLGLCESQWPNPEAGQPL